MPGAVWLREPRRTRAEPALTLPRIVSAAVELLDGAGIAGLTMRRLAETLDVHATSLYWHVANRDDLLDLALDAVLGEVGLPAEHDPDWSVDVASYLREMRGVLLRHPWSAALAGSRPLIGPNALARSEFVYTALVSAGLTGTDLSAAASAISNFVIGSASTEISWQHGGQDTARRAVNEHLQRRAETYPTLAAQTPTLDDAWEDHFERGMRFLLAGIAAG